MGRSFYNNENYTIDDLNNLIKNEIEESILLDYKASGSLSKSDGKKKEIGKDVSAFANSDGGIIIYGIEEKDHKPISFSYVDGDEFNKEWLENTIDGNMRQPIQGLEIYPIRVDGDFAKTIYIVKIPSSTDAPHMCSDKRYYRRYNFKSVSMEEYEVRLLYARVSLSELKLTDLGFEYRGQAQSPNSRDCHKFVFAINVMNVSDTIELNCKVHIDFKNVDFSRFQLGLDNTVNTDWKNTEAGMVGISGHNSAPIFPDEEMTIVKFQMFVDLNYYDEIFENGQMKLTLYDSNSKKNAIVQLSQVLNIFR